MRKIALLLAAAALAVPALAVGPKFSTSGGVGSSTSVYVGGEPNGGTFSINGTTGTVSTPIVNLRPGTAPASPQNGDCWTTIAGLFCRINGATVGPYASSVGAGTVTQVGLVPPSIFTAGAPVTSNGNLSFSLNSQSANQVFAGPNGSSGTPGFRALVGADIPAVNVGTSGNGGVTGTLAIANGGTGGTTATAARNALGLGTAATQNTGTSGATVPLLDGANTWSLGQTFPFVTLSRSGISVAADVRADAGFTATTTYRSGASQRWAMGRSATAESGSNAGSDFFINRYDDAGAFVSSPFQINRATGAVSLGSPLAVASGGTGAATGAANRVFATPDGSTGAPSFRSMTSADLPNFLNTATGASARSIPSRLNDTVSVLDFGGCDKTGVADSTTCFQAAANSNAATITIPAGNYKLSGLITIPATKCPMFEGAGISSTTITQTSGTAGGFFFNNGASQFMCGGGGVRNLTLKGSTSTFTTYSTGTAIAVNGGGYLSLTDLHIEGWQTGISFNNTHNTFNGRISMQFLKGAGIEIGGDDAYGAPSGNTWDGIVIGNTGATFDISGSTGMTIYQSGGDFIRNVDFARMGYGMTITPRAGKQVAYIWLDSALFDTSVNDGLFIRAQDGSFIYSINAVNSWSAFNDGFGIFTEAVGTGKLDSFRWIGGRIRQNKKAGVVFNPGTQRAALQNSEVSNNGRTTTPGTWPGVSVAPGVNYFQITGNTLGNFAPADTPSQGTSIQIQAGASDHYVVTQNVCFAPAGGASCITDGGTGTDKAVAQNVGP